MPIRKSADNRKAAIVVAMLRLANELGPDRLTTAAVAQAKLGIFGHFPTKQDLWLAVAAHMATTMTAACVAHRKRRPAGRVCRADGTVSGLVGASDGGRAGQWCPSRRSGPAGRGDPADVAGAWSGDPLVAGPARLCAGGWGRASARLPVGAVSNHKGNRMTRLTKLLALVAAGVLAVGG